MSLDLSEYKFTKEELNALISKTKEELDALNTPDDVLISTLKSDSTYRNTVMLIMADNVRDELKQMKIDKLDMMIEAEVRSIKKNVKTSLKLWGDIYTKLHVIQLSIES